MKVCHVTSVHPTTDTRLIIKECPALAEAGYETYLVGKGESREEKGVHVIGVGEPPKSRIKRMLTFTNTVYKKALELDCEVYHLHDPELLPCALKFKRKGKKVVFDSHEDVPVLILDRQWIPKLLRKIIATAYKNYEIYVTKRLDAVVAATPYITERFLKINSNSYNVNNFPVVDAILAHTSNKNYFQLDNAVCYAGGLTVNRGTSDIVSAINECSCNLRLAGKVDHDSFMEELLSLDGSAKTEFLGYLNPTQIYELYNTSKAGLCVLRYTNNHYNSLPVKMFEYMAAGLPVVASNFPLWREIIEENECGICVEAGNIEEIAKAINYLVENPEQAQRMGQNGRKAAESKYNWQTEKEELLRLYKKLS